MFIYNSRILLQWTCAMNNIIVSLTDHFSDGSLERRMRYHHANLVWRRSYDRILLPEEPAAYANSQYLFTQLLDNDSSTVICMNFNLMPSRYSFPEISVHANPWWFLRPLGCCRLVLDPYNPRRSSGHSSRRSCVSSIPFYQRPIIISN